MRDLDPVGAVQHERTVSGSFARRGRLPVQRGSALNWASDLLAGLGDRVVVNMVTTVDGRAAIDGSSRELGGDADLEMLVALRRWAQVLVVGSGTVRAEGYGKIRRDLLVVVVSRSGRFPLEAPLFSAADQPVETSTDEPAALVASLRERGLTRVLCEGGPSLLRAWLAADVVDDLFLTVHPVLTADGSQPRIVEGEPFAEPLRAELVWAVPHGGELFLRYGVREKTH